MHKKTVSGKRYTTYYSVSYEVDWLFWTLIDFIVPMNVHDFNFSKFSNLILRYDIYQTVRTTRQRVRRVI